MHKNFNKELFILLFFLLLSIILASFYLRQNPSGFPASYPGEAADAFHFIWSFWWVKQWLLGKADTLFYSNISAVPLGVDLHIHCLMIFAGILLAPITSLFGVLNTPVFLAALACFLCGWFAYLLAKFLTGSLLAAFFVGFGFVIITPRVIRLGGHYNLFYAQWIPLTVYLVLQFIKQKKSYCYLLTIPFMGWILFVDCQYYFILTVLILSLYFLGVVLFDKEKRNNKTYILKFIIALSALFILIIPQGITSLIVTEKYGIRTTTTIAEADWFGPDAASLIIPYTTNKLTPKFLNSLQEKVHPMGVEKCLFLGLTVLLTAAYGIKKYWKNKPDIKAWALVAIVLILLSLGPYLTFYGFRTITSFGKQIGPLKMPFYFLGRLPLLNTLRTPGRIIIPASLVVLILSAYGLAWIEQNKSKKTARVYFLVIMLGLLIEHNNSLPFMVKPGVPGVIKQLASEPPGTVLQIPPVIRDGHYRIGRLDSEKETLPWQYFQTIYNKPTLSAYFSRIPYYVFQYFQQIPFLRVFFAMETKGENKEEIINTIEEEKKWAAKVFSLMDIKYILIYPGWREREEVNYALNIIKTKEIIAKDGYYLYKIQPKIILKENRVNFGIDDRLYYSGPWGMAMAKKEKNFTYRMFFGQGYILLPFYGDTDGLLKFRAKVEPLNYSLPTKIQMDIDNKRIFDKEITNEWQIYKTRCKIPPQNTNLVKIWVKINSPRNSKLCLDWAEITKLQ